MRHTYNLLEEKLESLTGDVRSQLEEIELELDELKLAKLKLTALLRVLDPQPVAKRNGELPQTNVSEDSVTRLYNYLHDNREQLNVEGFYAKGLIQDPDFTALKNISTVSRSLLVLHERDLITLVARGRGGKRIYKVV